MTDTTAETATKPTETVTPKPETGGGIKIPANVEQAPDGRTLETAEARIKELNAENIKWRKQFEAAEKATADAEAKRLAEQGEYQRLYEAEKAKAAETEARLRQIEFDNQRKDAAQAAGIPSLWQRLQGDTAEALAEDAAALAALMQPAQPANGQATRQTTMPTPAPQGRQGLTDEERRAKAARTF